MNGLVADGSGGCIFRAGFSSRRKCRENALEDAAFKNGAMTKIDKPWI